jgi:hypothetical protein
MTLGNKTAAFRKHRSLASAPFVGRAAPAAMLALHLLIPGSAYAAENSAVGYLTASNAFWRKYQVQNVHSYFEKMNGSPV